MAKPHPNQRKQPPVFVCPHCGTEVKAGAVVCPGCGSDETTGWAEDAGKWEADIPTGYGPEEGFSYREFVRREFPGQSGRPGSPLGRAGILRLIGVILAIAGLLLLLFLR
jgi:hypothetical protein